MTCASAHTRRWPALLLAFAPGLLAAKGCYWGEQDVPLGGNPDGSAGGYTSVDEMGGAAGSSAASAAGVAGTAGSAGVTPTARPGTEMREPDVFGVD